MSYPARDNQITFGAVLAWLLIIVFAVVVLYFFFGKSSGPASQQNDWSSEDYATPGFEQPDDPLALIADMEWLLTDLRGEGDEFPLSDEVNTTFRCNANGRFGGNAGCNNYFGNLVYDSDQRTLTIGPVGSTMMACPPPKAEQEGAYLGALERATRIELGGHRLRLSSGDDSTVLIFSLVFPGEVGEAQTPPVEQGNIDVDAQSIAGGKTARASMIYRGTLELADQQLGFVPCGAEFTIPVEDNRFDLDGVAGQLGLDLASGVYAEFRARLRSQDEQGLRLQLEDPLFMANEGGSCDHPTPVASLVASGNEPFWTLVVGQEFTTLKTPKGEWRLNGSMHPDDAFFSAPRGQRDITFTNEEEGIEVRASFEKEPCRDSMVDAWYVYTARVFINGNNGSGCARPGRFLPSAMGRYGANLPAASSPGRRLDLLLHDSGFATLATDYQNGKPVIHQQGIWQQRDASTVEIQFMAINGKPAMDRMVFTSDGNSMVAVEFDPKHWGDQGLRLSRIIDGGK